MFCSTRLQRQRAALHMHIGLNIQRYALPGDFVDYILQAQRHGGLIPLPADEIQIAGNHALHVVDVVAHGLDILWFSRHGELQLQARKGRAEIVRDSGQHLRALLHLTGNTPAHIQEGFFRLGEPPARLRA